MSRPYRSTSQPRQAGPDHRRAPPKSSAPPLRTPFLGGGLRGGEAGIAWTNEPHPRAARLWRHARTSRPRSSPRHVGPAASRSSGAICPSSRRPRAASRPAIPQRLPRPGAAVPGGSRHDPRVGLPCQFTPTRQQRPCHHRFWQGERVRYQGAGVTEDLPYVAGAKSLPAAPRLVLRSRPWRGDRCATKVIE
jgi:hypothetical protein